MFDAARNKPITRTGSARLCGYSTYFERQVESWAQCKNNRPYEACGDDSYSICVLYNVPLHFFPQKGFQTKNTWVLKYNSDKIFGLAQSD